jgi:hypothetical protein
MRRLLRYVRIAFSATCGIACVLLCVLWARSFTHYDQLHGTLGGRSWFSIESERGRMVFSTSETTETSWGIRSGGLDDFPPDIILPGDVRIVWPHWILALPAAVISAAPWIRWRFRVRTLLIAITVVAILLGMIVYVCSRTPVAPTSDESELSTVINEKNS